MARPGKVATPRAPVTARGKKTREDLLRAAEAVFGKVGFDQASITEITQRAGVAQGTFYIHFADKKALFVELVQALADGLIDAVRSATVGLSDPMAVERARLRAFFVYCAEHPRLYRIVRQAEFVDERAYRTYYRRLAKGYAEDLEKAMALGLVARFDPEHLAYSLMGMADFLGMRWVLWEKHRDVDALVEHAMKLLLHGLAPNAEARSGALSRGPAARARDGRSSPPR